MLSIKQNSCNKHIIDTALERKEDMKDMNLLCVLKGNFFHLEQRKKEKEKLTLLLSSCGKEFKEWTNLVFHLNRKCFLGRKNHYTYLPSPSLPQLNKQPRNKTKNNPPQSSLFSELHWFVIGLLCDEICLDSTCYKYVSEFLKPM